jgi:hypothetical protein
VPSSLISVNCVLNLRKRSESWFAATAPNRTLSGLACIPAYGSIAEYIASGTLALESS